MSMRAIKKAVATIGKYTDKTGAEKNQYLTVGKLLEREDGSLCLKLDAIPVNFTGWLSFYDLDENRQANNEQGMQQARQAAGKSAPEPTGGGSWEDDTIPFSNYEYRTFA